MSFGSRPSTAERPVESARGDARAPPSMPPPDLTESADAIVDSPPSRPVERSAMRASRQAITSRPAEPEEPAPVRTNTVWTHCVSRLWRVY